MVKQTNPINESGVLGEHEVQAALDAHGFIEGDREFGYERQFKYTNKLGREKRADFLVRNQGQETLIEVKRQNTTGSADEKLFGATTYLINSGYTRCFLILIGSKFNPNVLEDVQRTMLDGQDSVTMFGDGDPSWLERLGTMFDLYESA